MVETTQIKVRLPNQLLMKITGTWGLRRTMIITALTHYFTEMERRQSVPVALQKELAAVRDVKTQLQKIGVNLNQIAAQLNKLDDGNVSRKVDAQDLKETHNELKAAISKATAILKFWRMVA